MARTVAQRCFHEMMMDSPLSPSVMVDFGIESQNHHRAIQQIVKNGATIEELDSALGSGEKISALVKKYAPQYANIEFVTAYDEIESSP